MSEPVAQMLGSIDGLVATLGIDPDSRNSCTKGDSEVHKNEECQMMDWKVTDNVHGKAVELMLGFGGASAGRERISGCKLLRSGIAVV